MHTRRVPNLLMLIKFTDFCRKVRSSPFKRTLKYQNVKIVQMLSMFFRKNFQKIVHKQQHHPLHSLMSSEPVGTLRVIATRSAVCERARSRRLRTSLSLSRGLRPLLVAFPGSVLRSVTPVRPRQHVAG